MGPKWLEEFCKGASYEYTPEVVDETENFAILQLSTSGAKGYHSVGYILVPKNGGFNGPRKSLYEGLPDGKTVEKMVAQLHQAEENGHL